ncbi:abortive infection family protein [Paracoccus sp. N5]|uniref:abortive infection family protein n=1 Tax=Paracoccus sp. N5 TaxID=1101189 RepID=UPI000380CDD6|nr:abortive infection family protein [Paracoccus sp. N5]
MNADAEKIPSPLIGILGDIFSEFYTHAEINRVFTYADAPGDPPDGNKIQKTVDWLRRVNKQSGAPLLVLGFLLEGILEKEPFDTADAAPWDQDEPEWSVKLRKDQERIHSMLGKVGLLYSIGGHIGVSSGTATATLREMIDAGGLGAIQIEMDRALKQVESDPNAAAHYAGNILEATLKAYLIKKCIPFNDQADTLNRLWELVRDSIGINPKDLESKDLKKIASGLNSIVDGTMYLRNKKSGAHGRTEEQFEANALRPRHARLVIHSAHTLAAYVLECLAEK